MSIKDHIADARVAELAPGMVEFLTVARGIVEQEFDPARVASAIAASLRGFLQRPDLLLPEHRMGDPKHYRQHVLHVEDDGSFSVVSLVWLEGQHTPIHDHVSWCVVGVYKGEELETRYEVTGSGSSRLLMPKETSVNGRLSTSGFAPPGDIHQVSSNCGETTISIHVYGADIRTLGTSIRRRYNLPVSEAPTAPRGAVRAPVGGAGSGESV